MGSTSPGTRGNLATPTSPPLNGRNMTDSLGLDGVWRLLFCTRHSENHHGGNTTFAEIIKEFNYCSDALRMSDWMKDCFAGQLDKVEGHLRRDPTLLDRRESPLLMNGLMYAIHGYKLRATKQHAACIEYLVEMGTPVNCRDLAGFTALYQLVCGCEWGVVGGSSELTRIARFLLDRGADINMKNRLGNSPISASTSSPDTRFLRWLLENGADPGATNNDGVIFHDHAMITGWHFNRLYGFWATCNGTQIVQHRLGPAGWETIGLLLNPPGLFVVPVTTNIAKVTTNANKRQQTEIG